MAALGTSGITSVVLSMMMAEPIVANINREVVGLNLLDVLPGGDPLSWNVKLRARTAAAAVAETAAAPTASSHARVKATLNMGEYADTASVTGRAAAAAAMALNPLGVAGGNDLLMDEIKDAVLNVGEAVGDAFYTGDGSTDDMSGLAIQIDGSDDNFAGIDTGVYTDWKSTESAATLATFTLEDIRVFLTAIRTASGKRANLAITTPTVLDKIRGKFATYPDYVSAVPINGVQRALVSGARALYVEDCWFVDDPRCTSNTVYALNTDYIKLRSMPPFTSQTFSADQIAAEMTRITGETVRAAEAAALVERTLGRGLVPYLKRLGAAGNQDSLQVGVYVNLQMIRRDTHGKLVFS